MAISATIVFVPTVIELALVKYEFMVSGQLTNYGSRCMLCACILVIFFVFVAKTVSNKRFEMEEE